MLQSMGLQRAGHDLVTEQQHSIYETCKDILDLSITCTELGDLLFITWRVSFWRGKVLGEVWSSFKKKN